MLLLALLFFRPFVGLAQEQPPISRFSIDASAMGFSGASQSSAATIIGGSVGMTKRFALGYQQILVPDLNANYYLGIATYTLQLKTLLGQRISAALIFDASKFNVRFLGGAGVNRQQLSEPLNQKIAATLGGALEYSANNTLSVEIFSAQWIHAGIKGFEKDRFVVTPNTAAIASGLKLKF
jgi:hypothetical protein